MNSVEKLVKVMAALRDPESGCPWDLEQDFKSIAPYTLEEAYEVVEAIERDASDELKEELGDLLLQVAYHSRMAEEAGWFDFEAVAEGIAAKMIERHPHVFANASVESAKAQTHAWEAKKEAERAEKGKGSGTLDGVSTALPGLTRAVKIQRRAARVGFDWADFGPVLDKIEEELGELRHEIEHKGNHDAKERMQDELGDLLFAVSNLARHLDIDPEQALRGTMRKFETRFAAIEAALAKDGREPKDSTLEEMDRLWEEAKKPAV